MWIRSLWINALFTIYSEAAKGDFGNILTLFLLTLNKSVLIKFQNDNVISSSSIVKSGYQGIFKSVYFLLRKGFEHKKTPKRKTDNFQPLRTFCLHEKCCLCCLVFAQFCFVSWFLLASVFLRSKLFRKKNNKQAWNCLDNLVLLYYSFCYNKLMLTLATKECKTIYQ